MKKSKRIFEEAVKKIDKENMEQQEEVLSWFKQICAMRASLGNDLNVFSKDPPRIKLDSPLRVQVNLRAFTDQLLDESTKLEIKCFSGMPKLKVKPKEGLAIATELLSTLHQQATNATEGGMIEGLVAATRKFFSCQASEFHSASSDEDLTIASSHYSNNFEDLGKLGRGGYGCVYKCRNRLDNIVYTIKKLPLNDTTREKTMREVQVHSILQHQRIVRYHQAWIEDGYTPVPHSSSEDDALTSDSLEKATSTLYIQMEFCPDTLDARITAGLDNRALIWGFCGQIVDGLCYIHHKGVIHRDISRYNIFLDASGDVKIGDFGLAVFFPTDGTTLDITRGVGHAIYRAPEMSWDTPRINEKVDIFSIGILMFEMLRGFETESTRLLTMLFREEGDDLVLVHPTLQKILSKAPSDRPSAREILEVLEQMKVEEKL